MGTSTPNYGLRKPERGVAGAPDDLVSAMNDVQAANQIIDTRMTDVVCTSTTRPTMPRNSELIYETDTGAVYRWNASGSIWALIGTKDGPNGGIQVVNQAATVTLTNVNQAVVSVTPAFLISPTRRYTLYTRIHTRSTTSATGTYGFSFGSNTGAVFNAGTFTTLTANFSVGTSTTSGYAQTHILAAAFQGSATGIAVPTQCTFSTAGILIAASANNVDAVFTAPGEVGTISIRDAGEV